VVNGDVFEHIEDVAGDATGESGGDIGAVNEGEDIYRARDAACPSTDFSGLEGCYHRVSS